MIIRVFNRIKERKIQKMILLKNRRKEIEKRADDILVKNELLKPGFDLIKFLKENEKFEIAMQNMPKETSGFILVNEKSNILGIEAQKLIAINSMLQKETNFMQRSRFVIAHEYAHSVLHKREGIVFAHRSTAKKMSKQEQEADYFARCLLMPERLIIPMMKDNDFKQLTPNTKISYISKVFNVTPKKAKKRLKELSCYE